MTAAAERKAAETRFRLAVGDARALEAESAPDHRMDRILNGVRSAIASVSYVRGSQVEDPGAVDVTLRDAIETLDQVLVDVAAEQLGLDVTKGRVS